MRENRPSGSEGGARQINALSLPLSFPAVRPLKWLRVVSCKRYVRLTAAQCLTWHFSTAVVSEGNVSDRQTRAGCRPAR